MKKFKMLVSASLLALATFSMIFMQKPYADQQNRRQSLNEEVIVQKKKKLRLKLRLKSKLKQQ